MEGFVPGSIKDRSWKEVPEERKRVNGGTYEQAPDGPYEGEWFDTGGAISIFGGGQKPWDLAEQQSDGGGHKSPPGFVELFGDHPSPQDYPSGMAYRVAREAYRSKLRTFVGVGVPGFLTAEQVKAADVEFEDWGMGKSVHYQTTDGWWSRFPDPSIQSIDGYYKLPEGADVADFSMATDTVVRFPHLAVATFQVYCVTQSRKVDPSIGIGEVLGNNRKHPLLTGVAV